MSKKWIVLACVVLLASTLLACNGWDGMDRTGAEWTPAPLETEWPSDRATREAHRGP